jgi:hypothetical protein
MGRILAVMSLDKNETSLEARRAATCNYSLKIDNHIRPAVHVQAGHKTKSPTPKSQSHTARSGPGVSSNTACHMLRATTSALNFPMRCRGEFAIKFLKSEVFEFSRLR